MSESFNYLVDVVWTEGRKGIISSETLNDKIEVATPPDFPKGVPGIWSPEHLYVASSNVCLMTTFLAIAENSKLDFVSFKCKATGKLEKIENKYMISEIILEPEIRIKDEKDKERAERIIHKSEAACLISNSMKTKIILLPKIII